MWKALVHVTQKREVLDPQGKAIQRAAVALGCESVTGVRQGKLFEIELDVPDAAHARVVVDELGKKLLANPVIENYALVRLEE